MNIAENYIKNSVIIFLIASEFNAAISSFTTSFL